MQHQPADANIDRAGIVGPFSVTAVLGPPVSVRTTVAGFAYERIVIGCAQGNGAGVRFDAGGIARVTDRAEDADIYITGPILEASAAWDACRNTFHDPTAKNFTLHVPGGAIDINAGPDGFTAVSARDWRGPTATSFEVPLPHDTLLLRTRNKRLVKILAVTSATALVGPTLTADEHDAFADSSSTRQPAMTQTHVPDDTLENLIFTASIVTDQTFMPYGTLEELEVTKPYHGSLFPNRATSIDVVLDPLPYPTPSVTWSTAQDAATLPDKRLIAIEGEPGFPPQHASVVGALTGRTEIVASIGPPVSRRLTISAVSYDALALFARGSPLAVRFLGNRAVAVPSAAASDLFLSRDGTLHFPGGGNLLTNGSDPLRKPPAFARAAVAFTQLQPDAWRKDRDTLDAATWRAATSPCFIRQSDGTDRWHPACKTMSANVLLFKLRDGRYVKLHILDFFGAAIRATFAVSNAGGTFGAVDARASGPGRASRRANASSAVTALHLPLDGPQHVAR